MLEIRRQSPRWYLSVSDDGRGITEGAQRDLGKGFGFETVKRRAREIGALLDIQSRLGEGTTVTLLFVPHAEDHRLRGHMYIREIWKRIRGMS
jgi:signal transduction histidine kinase